MTLLHEVECDAADAVAGHQGLPEVVQHKRRKGRRNRRKGQGGRGILEQERPPVCGMMQRCGQVVINMMYARLCAWGYEHKSVNHGRGAYARDDAGDGLCAVQVHTMEGFWSLWWRWLRPHRGISQEKLPL